MSTGDNLNPRQRRLLARLAAGHKLTEAAADANYSLHHACRLQHSDRGQAEIARLTLQAQEVLAAALPKLVADALLVLQAELEHPIADRRLSAAQFVLKNLAAPLVAANAKKAKDEEKIVN